MGWLDPPWVVSRPFREHGRGRGRKTPRLLSGGPPSRRIDAMLGEDGFRNQPWVRWRVVERCFEDQKSEIGLDPYEGRRYQGLLRHLILSCVS